VVYRGIYNLRGKKFKPFSNLLPKLALWITAIDGIIHYTLIIEDSFTGIPL